MFADIYVIQTVPPNNINRDDTGAPKTCVYGGVRRARVSSQAWKRAMREDFRKYLPEGLLGVRTKLAPELIAEKIRTHREDLSDQADQLAEAVLTALGIKVKPSKRAGEDEGKNETGYLIFIAQHELDALVDIAIGWVNSGKNIKKIDKAMKDEAKTAFHGTMAVDIALFGRMLADVPQLNTDASAQVAHAISVDAITQEYDYFTAVDDCASDDNAGAGMIGTIDFDSSTLYRYATVDIDSLHSQLGDVDATIAGLGAFVRAFACSMPTGKQNTFANRTLPNYLVVALREAQPINMVSAFETPVHADDGTSIARKAAGLLGKRMKGVQTAFGVQPEGVWYVSDEGPVPSLDEVGTSCDMDAMVSCAQKLARKSLVEE